LPQSNNVGFIQAVRDHWTRNNSGDRQTHLSLKFPSTN
jgi:hypothetical protein